MENQAKRSTVIRAYSVTRLCAIVFILVSLPLSSYAGKLDPTESLDYGFDLYEDSRFENAETALLELLESSAFRRLDNSQQALAYAHIAYSKINRGEEKTSISYIDKALAHAKREFGKQSLPYLSHLRTKAIALYWSGDRRKAFRTAEDMLDILERMEGDYRDEKGRIKALIGDMRKSDVDENELPLDLSDFYTDCESIDDGQFLAKTGIVMNDYKLIGKDIKPDYKQSQYFKNAYKKHARESSQDRKNRLIYVLDEDHLDEWCVIYPDKKLIDRVVISTSDDH